MLVRCLQFLRRVEPLASVGTAIVAAYYRAITSNAIVAVQRLRAQPDTAAWRWETAPLLPSEKVCVFVTYAPNGVIPRRASSHAATWRAEGYEVLFVVVVDDFSIRPDIPFGCAIVRENRGHDFAAWSRALREIPLGATKVLATVNDSVFASPSLGPVIRRAEHSPADVVGFTENYEYRWHIQSYAVLFKGACIQSQAFARFWTPRLSGTRLAVIRTYEVKMAEAMTAEGYTTEVLFRVASRNNPTELRWPELARAGFPYLKRSALKRNYDEWRDRFAASGFDVDLIESERPTSSPS